MVRNMQRQNLAIFPVGVSGNKTRTSKVGAISIAQKAHSFSRKKCKRRDPLGFISIHSVAKYEKTRRGTLFRHLKIFRKKSHSAEKNPKRGPFRLVWFLGYLEKVKNERGTLCTTFALAGLGLMVVVLVVSKKNFIFENF